jgi:hypothetical protein
LFHTEAQIEMTKLSLALRNFTKASSNFFIIPTQGINVFHFIYTKNSDYFPDSINVLVFVTETEFILCQLESTSKMDLQRLRYNNIG